MPFERYKSEVVDRLHRYQHEGYGDVIELCEVGDGSENIALVGFRGRGTPISLFTAMHHSADVFFTSEAVFRLIEGGATDYFAVPVMDAVNYDKALATLERWEEQHPTLTPLSVHDMYREKGQGNWSGIPVRNWNDYWHYGHDDAPDETQAIQRLFELYPGIGVVLDMHGSNFDYAFPTPKLSGKDDQEMRIARKISDTIRLNGQKVMESLCSQRFNGLLGFYVATMKSLRSGDICSYAGNLGVPNFFFCAPVTEYSDGALRFRDREKMIRTNAAILNSAIEAVR